MRLVAQDEDRQCFLLTVDDASQVDLGALTERRIGDVLSGVGCDH